MCAHLRGQLTPYIVIMQEYALWHGLVHDHRASPWTAGNAANRYHPHLPPRWSVHVNTRQRTSAHMPPTVCVRNATGTADGREFADWRLWRHNGAMPSVQIKDVPEDTHAVLRQRAAAAHQSLQEYLRSRLIEEAAQPTLDEVLTRAGGRSGGSVTMKAAVAALREDRARR
jgi:plasmid stability protein